MTNHDPDDAEVAPLPPYERGWRHPAERADEERREYAKTSAPPPLGRRARTTVATVAALVGLAVLSVAIPKGISDYTSRGDDVTVPQQPSTSFVPIKGMASNPAVTVAGVHGTTSALSVGGRHLVAALEDVTSKGDVWITTPSGEDVAATVVAADPETGLALLRVAFVDAAKLPKSSFSPSPRNGAAATPLQRADIDALQLIDARGTQDAGADDGVTTPANRTFPLVKTERAIAGVAVAISDTGQVMGIAVRRAQATWIMQVGDLWSVLTTKLGLDTAGD